MQASEGTVTGGPESRRGLSVHRKRVRLCGCMAWPSWGNRGAEMADGE